MRTSCHRVLAVMCLASACQLDVGGKLERDATDARSAPPDLDAGKDATGDGYEGGADAAQDAEIPAADAASDGGGGNDGGTGDVDAGMDPPCTPGSPSDGSCGFAVRRKITFDAALLTEALVDFPALIVLDSTRVDYQKVQADGRDLRFVDEDGVTLLAHEIELWNPNGKSYVWVKVPRISALTATDHIWMVYGNPAAKNAQRAKAVWSSGYRGVWHLSEVPTSAASLKDSVGAPGGRASAGMDASDRVEGRVGFAIDFDGVEHTVDLGLLNASGWTELTLEAVVRNRGKTQSCVVCQAGADVDEGDLNLGLSLDDQKIHANVATSGNDSSDGAREVSGATLDEFQHIALTWKAATSALHVYRNGKLLQQFLHTGSELASSTHRLTIGALTAMGGLPLNGIVDEVRISNVTRSGTWIAAEALSMDDQGLMYGPEEPLP